MIIHVFENSWIFKKKSGELMNNKIKVICAYLVFIIITMFITAGNAAFSAKKTSGPEMITFTANDGFYLTGDLYVPANATIKSKVPMVILLHSIGGSKIDWNQFPNDILKLNVAVLNMELRGHGKSIINKKNKPKYWQNFKSTEFQKYPDDVIKAISYVGENYPNVDTGNVAIVGSNIGANAAVIAGSKLSYKIKNLVLLSPTTSSKGLDTRIPLVNYGKHPTLIMVSKSDSDAYFSANELIKYAQGTKKIINYPYGGNGATLLRFQPNAKKLVLTWLESTFLKGIIINKTNTVEQKNTKADHH